MLKTFKILSRPSNNIFATNGFLRSKHSNEGYKLLTLGTATSKSSYHQTHVQQYPATETLPLPSNIEDLACSEKFKFSPQRSRDISGLFISSGTLDAKDEQFFPMDDRIQCYDCSGAVNLSSTMQTNVPYPFVSKGKPTHLNMPGGQWRQSEKYTSDDLNNLHHSNTKCTRSRGTCVLGTMKGTKNTYVCLMSRSSTFHPLYFQFSINELQLRSFCTVNEKVKSLDNNSDIKKKAPQVPELSRKEKLKAAVKDYGSVVIVFHIGVSLLSLGCCYLAVTSGVDFSTIIKNWGPEEGAATVGTAAQFVVAYAIHKAMAPGRVALTIAAVPFIVKKLRKIGFLKPPKPQS